MKTKILFWNVDTQVDFVEPEGKLYVKDAEKLKPTLAILTEFAEYEGIRVVNTCDYHNEESQEIAENYDLVNTFPPHCMKDTKGQEFVDETQPEDPLIFDWDKEYKISNRTLSTKKRNIVIRKDAFDVFKGNPYTELILETLSPDVIFVYGVATNVCVNFAVTGLRTRGYNVFVIADAIKALPNIPSPLKEWESIGIKLITSSTITYKVKSFI